MQKFFPINHLSCDLCLLSHNSFKLFLSKTSFLFFYCTQILSMVGKRFSTLRFGGIHLYFLFTLVYFIVLCYISDSLGAYSHEDGSSFIFFQVAIQCTKSIYWKFHLCPSDLICHLYYTLDFYVSLNLFLDFVS